MFFSRLCFVKSGGGRDGPLSFHVVNRPLISTNLNGRLTKVKKKMLYSELSRIKSSFDIIIIMSYGPVPLRFLRFLNFEPRAGAGARKGK